MGNLICNLFCNTPCRTTFHSTKLFTPIMAPLSSVVFAVADSQGILPTLSKARSNSILLTIVQLTSQQVAQHLVAGYTGKGFSPFFGNNIGSVDPNILVQTVKKLVDSTNVPVYIMNTISKGADLTSEEITKILTATADGSAVSTLVPLYQQLWYLINKFLKGNAAGKGFTLLTPVTSIKGVSVSGGDASKEKQIVDHLKTAFPNVTF
jgi:hypothetical protein